MDIDSHWAIVENLYVNISIVQLDEQSLFISFCRKIVQFIRHKYI